LELQTREGLPLQAEIRRQEVEGALPEGGTSEALAASEASSGGFWDWLSWDAWKSWGANKLLNAVMGQPEVATYLRDTLPKPFVYLSEAISCLAKELLTETRLYNLVMEYNSDRHVNERMWKELHADARLQGSLENTILIMTDNIMGRLSHLVRRERDQEFFLDLVSDMAGVASKHFEGLSQAIERYPDGGAKVADYWNCFAGDQLHSALAGDYAQKEAYYRWAGDCIARVGLPREGRELEHLARLAQGEAYEVVRQITPHLARNIKRRVLHEHTMNHLVIAVVELLEKQDLVAHFSRPKGVQRAYSHQKDLDAHLGQLSRHVAECVFPTVTKRLFSIFNLEEAIGKALGRLCAQRLRTRSIDLVVTRCADGAVAALCEGHFVEEESGRVHFQPKRCIDPGQGVERIVLSEPGPASKRQDAAEKAERVLATFLRDLVPRFIRAKWEGLKRFIRPLIESLPMGIQMWRTLGMLMTAFSVLLDSLMRLSRVRQLVAHLGLRLSRPIAQRILAFLYHPAHENLYLHLQDTLLRRLDGE
jgi:hypothetical protein